MARRNFTLADIKSGKLHVGMKVRVNELDSIKGIWMLLKDAEVIDDENGICTSEGTEYDSRTCEALCCPWQRSGRDTRQSDVRNAADVPPLADLRLLSTGSWEYYQEPV